MRRLILLTLLLLALVVPASASASTWYWSQSAANTTLVDHYRHAADSECTGLGRSIRVPSGKRGYRVFDCLLDFDDGSYVAGTLRVVSKTRFSFSVRTRGSVTPPPNVPPGGTTIPNYPNGHGYTVQCADGTYSQSGGIQGACSHHGGVG
jgi:hypothetical protein